MTERHCDYLLRLRPLPDSVPAIHRLRRALKLLLRGFGLRCVHHQELRQDQRLAIPAARHDAISTADGSDVALEDIGGPGASSHA
jgi:hypothetical protein